MVGFFKKRPYIAFLVPGLILYTMIYIYPIFSAVQISLFRWNGIGPKVFVGLSNYKELFTDAGLMSQFFNALGNSMKLFALTVFIQLPLQIILAYMIHSKTKGHKFSQTAIYAPQFISTPVIVFIFKLLLDNNVGIVNNLLRMAGQEQLIRPWLGIPELGMYILYIMISWGGLGVGMMFLIGAMKMVDYDCIEAAYLDGVGFWKRLITIILPQIKLTILNLVLISYIFAMTTFDFSYVLGGASGGIDGSLDVMSLLFYRIAFGDVNPIGGKISENSMGMGTTVACVLFGMIFVISLIQVLMLTKKKED